MARESQPGAASLTLTPLARVDTTLVSVQPQFLQTLSDHLGDHLTPADGFDALLNEPLSTIDTESDSVDSLGSSAQDVAALPGSFTPDALSAIASDIATFNTSGDNIANTFGLTAAPPPPPPADTSGFKNTGNDGGVAPPPPPGPGNQGNPDLGGVMPPMDSGL